MKGIHTYLGLALLLSVAFVPNAFSTEENLAHELTTAEEAKALVAKAVACAQEAGSQAVKRVEGAFAAPTRYERFSSLVGDARSWGARFGTGLYTKATSHATSLKDGFNGYAQKAQSGLASAKDAVTQYPYKTVAQDALNSVRDQALAHKPLLIGAGLAVAYESGALNLAAKPVVYAGKGLKAGAQKAYAAAKNHKQVTGGLSAAVISGAAGAGYYFKDALAQAAQSGLAHVQPMVTAVLENKSDIGKTAGIALVGVATIEGVRFLNSIRNLSKAPTLDTAPQAEIQKELAYKLTLDKLIVLIEEDIAAVFEEKYYVPSKFSGFDLNELNLFTQEDKVQAIRDEQDEFTDLYNKAFFNKNDETVSKLQDKANFIKKSLKK